MRRMRMQPGRMFLVDTAQGRIISDDEIKSELAAEHPYQQWIDEGLVQIDDLPESKYTYMTHDRVVLRQQIFGFTNEEVNLLVKPMAVTGGEALGSMGTDTPIAVLSARPRMLFDYFQQLFAQVTNPPLDAIREEIVTSLGGTIGPEADLLTPSAASCRQIVLPQPILHNDDLSKLIHLNDNAKFPHFRSVVVRGVYPVAQGGEGLRRHWTRCATRCRGDRRWRPHHRAVGPRVQREVRPDPVAAAHRRGASPPGAREDPYQGRSRRRVR